jgi:hypothetical protein
MQRSNVSHLQVIIFSFLSGTLYEAKTQCEPWKDLLETIQCSCLDSVLETLLTGMAFTEVSNGGWKVFAKIENVGVFYLPAEASGAWTCTEWNLT